MDESPKGAEKVMPYGGGAQKGAQVEEMFDSIAPAYDLMNTAMTFGLHRHWRDTALSAASRAIKEAGRPAPRAILDVATGTGDVAIELSARWPDASITGIDLSEGMLSLGRKKVAALPPQRAGRITLKAGDCLRLDFPDGGFDLVTVAYGVRNFERLEEGLREMLRVMAPGALLCIVELSEPESQLLHACYRLYSRHLIPAVGRMVSGDSRAYTYLPESIAAAPQRRDMALLLQKVGFRRCRWRSLTFGAVTFYLAQKPLP